MRAFSFSLWVIFNDFLITFIILTFFFLLFVSLYSLSDNLPSKTGTPQSFYVHHLYYSKKSQPSQCYSYIWKTFVLNVRVKNWKTTSQLAIHTWQAQIGLCHQLEPKYSCVKVSPNTILQRPPGLGWPGLDPILLLQKTAHVDFTTTPLLPSQYIAGPISLPPPHPQPQSINHCSSFSLYNISLALSLHFWGILQMRSEKQPISVSLIS